MGFAPMKIRPVISTDRAVDSRGGDLNPQSLKDAGSFTDGLHWSEIGRNRTPLVQGKTPWAYFKVYANGLVRPQILILSLFTHRHAIRDFLSFDKHKTLHGDEGYFEKMFSIIGHFTLLLSLKKGKKAPWK